MKEETNKPKEINVEFSIEVNDDGKEEPEDIKELPTINPYKWGMAFLAVLFIVSCMIQSSRAAVFSVLGILCLAVAASIKPPQVFKSRKKKNTIKKTLELAYFAVAYLSLVVFVVCGILYVFLIHSDNITTGVYMGAASAAGLCLFLLMGAIYTCHVIGKAKGWMPWWYGGL